MGKLKSNLLKRKYSSVLFLFIILSSSVFVVGIKADETSDVNPAPFFSFTLIQPFLSDWRFLADYWCEELAKIGISLEELVAMNWLDIQDRTIDQEGPIPNYNDGGFDIIQGSWGFTQPEWNPEIWFSSDSMPPNGFNLFQFNNSNFDQNIDDWQQAYYSEDKIPYIQNMINILDEELPIIPQIDLYGYCVLKEDITGIDPELWNLQYQQFELIDFGEQDVLRYGFFPPKYDYFVPPQVKNFAFPDRLIQNQIWRGLLIRENSTKTWTECIASDYFSDDGLNWTFEIDPEAKFADGTSVTAEDVIFSYQVILTPKLGSFDYDMYAYYFENESIIEVNDHTVRFELNHPINNPEPIFSMGILPKYIWEAIPLNNWSTQSQFWSINNPEKIFGAGPYQMSLYDTENRTIHLTKNEYFDDMINCQEANIENIYMYYNYGSAYQIEYALRNDYIDLIDPHWLITDIIETVTFPNCKAIKVSATNKFGLWLNLNNPYFGNGELCPIAGPESAKYVRKAMNCLKPMNRYEEEEEFGNFDPAASAIPSFIYGYDDELKSEVYNLTKAKVYMRLAGFDLPLDNGKGFIGIGIYILLGTITFISIMFNRKRNQ